MNNGKLMYTGLRYYLYSRLLRAVMSGDKVDEVWYQDAADFYDTILDKLEKSAKL